MSLTSCTIRFTKKSDRIVYATAPLLNQLNLTSNRNVQLRLGQNSVQVNLRTMRGVEKHLYMPDYIRRALRIPRSGSCQLHSDEDNTVRIGPLLGVLTSSSNATITSPFGVRTPLFRQLLRLGRGRSFFFAFKPRDINWSNDTVNGYFLGSTGGFVRRTVPLPDVVYNRLPSRRVEKSASMENFKERFIRRRIPIFNWSFFEKWDVYRLLEGDAASKYVPESFLNPSGAQIKEMLTRHQFVYLKPTGGSLGHGIFRLTYHPKRGYFCRFRHNGNNILLRYSRFGDLLRRLNRGGRMRNYVLQQGIRLVELDKCPIDFRFHMNKNADDKWVVAGIGAKRAGRGSVTTHIKNGGKLMTPESALTRIYGSSEKAGEVLDKAKRIAIDLAEAIERNYPHRLGEIGFDIGIDKRENIWMFEANSKPGRSIFKHPSLKAQGVQTLRHIYDYCEFLSRFRARRDS